MTSFVLETAGLVLKKLSFADAPGFYELNLAPEVLHNTGDTSFGSVVEDEAFIRCHTNYEYYG
ncbi:MAG TPA: hypothetical protein VLA49_03420 [Anaerolineales bacterium]|nr:hypothetical protein [Anaerolineales bacterium]